jgi:FkbM family methyltransferase
MNSITQREKILMPEIFRVEGDVCAASAKKVAIRHNDYWITTDPDYGKHLGERFEPNTVALLECLCDENSQILDIGANIGITGIALAQLSPLGKIAAIEPVPSTYQLLTKNVVNSGHKNITTHQFALGNSEGEIVMQGNPNNLSGAFVADKHTIVDWFHFSEKVKQLRLDDAFADLGLDRVDLIKIDVEGYELDALEGAAGILSKYQPMVMLEMNYVALNLWRSMSVPEFVERLLKMFPFVYAIQEDEFSDLRDKNLAHSVQFRHLTKWDFMDVVAGFDRQKLLDRLKRLPEIRRINAQYPRGLEQQLAEANQQIDMLQNMINSRGLEQQLAEANQQIDMLQNRISAIDASSSWRITAPLRMVKKLISA